MDIEEEGGYVVEQEYVIEHKNYYQKKKPEDFNYLLTAKNFPSKLRAILHEKNVAMIAAICYEFKKAEIVRFLRQASTMNRNQKERKPWASWFIRLIKDRLKKYNNIDKIKKIFGKTKRQKQVGQQRKRIKLILDRKGVEKIGDGGKNDELKKQIEELERRFETEKMNLC